MKQVVFIVSILLICRASAQEVLTLNDALRIALENNYAIQVVKNDAEVAKNNNRPGAAGMLPSVTGNASQDNQVVDSRQKFLNGTENNRDGAKSRSFNANIELGWTIFDGMKMFAAKNRLEELQKMGEHRMRSNIEYIFIRVIRGYYDVMLATRQLNSIRYLVISSTQRLDFATERYHAGKSAKTEMLKAQVDLNTDKASLLKQTTVVENAKTTLNQILARNLATDFVVADSLEVNTSFRLDEMMSKVENDNAGLQMMKSSMRVSMLGIKEIQAERYPLLQFRSGYNFSRQESQAGFLQYSQNNGFHFGATLSLNLFNGFDVNRRLRNANLTLRTSELIWNDSLMKVRAQLRQSFSNYELNKTLVELEESNVLVAKENVTIAEEQYRSGVITSLELRDAQQNLYTSELRLFSARYDLKMSEMELRRLTGQLIKI